MFMNEWINHPAMKSLDPIKQELIKNAASQTQGKSKKAMVPIMMALITNANRQKITFTTDEIQLIMEILKDGKSREEKEQIDRTFQMVSSYIKKNSR